MGTKIRANTLLREYPPMGSHYLGNQSFQNGPEKVRQTILEHESIFRQQLQELHRVYRRQKELTNEVKRGGFFPNGTYELGFPKLPLVDQASYNRDTKLSLCNNNADASMYNLYFKRTDRRTGDLRTTNPVDGEVSANSCSKFNLVTKDLLKNSIIGTNEKNGNEHLYDDFSEGRRYDREPLASPQSLLLAGPKKEFLNRRSKKIFGVEIYEENDDLFGFDPPMSSTLGPRFGPKQEIHRVVSFEPSSWIASTSMQTFNLDGKNEHSKAVEREPVKCFENSDDINSKKSEISKNDSESQNRGLPWFLRTSQVSNDMSKEKKSSYFMNMDSLQNSSRDFFKKAEVPDGSFRTLKPNTELSPKILGFPISDMVQKDLNSGDKNVSKANSMHLIDLNMSLDDEEDAVTSAIYEITTTNASPKEANTEKITDISHEERDRIAAEAIIAMSSSSSSSPSFAEVESSSNNNTNNNNLEWFAEIVSSQHSDEIDEFELTTLKLEDTKEERYHYTPFELYNNPPTDDDNRASLSKSSRRGQSRRGRQQRKDFQRDVLPGLITLSRRQVAEDFQTFEELMKGEQGGNWQLRLSQRGSVRNGRGRKRLNNTTCSGAKTVCSPERDRPVCETERPVCGIEERNGLSGWGKRTRRLPRQRCSNAVLSFTVKC
ncbi:hypothetical protein ABFS83_08G027000 [Erythranthe nasuta]